MERLTKFCGTVNIFIFSVSLDCAERLYVPLYVAKFIISELHCYQDVIKCLFTFNISYFLGFINNGKKNSFKTSVRMCNHKNRCTKLWIFVSKVILLDVFITVEALTVQNKFYIINQLLL